MKLAVLFLAVLVACEMSTEASQITGSKGKIYGSVTKRTDDKQRIEEAKVKPEIFDINRGIDGLIHGDVIPAKVSRNTMVDSSASFWPSTTIPYEFSNLTLYGLDLEGVAAIQLAIREYKLRTCMNFVPRTTEENYISFQKKSGCYSSVGMVGGKQIISIGNGCQQMSTVCHEMMHAIGIWHEQSRADRDNYVEIMWDVIEPGKEHNFNKYTWDQTDARRVPYDFYSVMHYSDTGFSTNGDPTIVTRDPAFQDIIGQRKTFSVGDSTKINRMYECGDTLLNSYNCNYDDEAECGYVQDYDSDHVDWLRYDVGDKSVTVSPNAPTSDSTVGVSGEGTYMILDTSGKQAGKLAEMRSMRFVTRSQTQCLQFSLYLDRDNSSTASVAVYIGSVDAADGTAYSVSDPIITLDKDYGNTWHIQRISINAPDKYRLVFVGKTDIYSDDVVAIDDVSVQDKPCEDDYFVVENYSNVLETFNQDEYFLSPVMTSTQGYNFKLLVYPQGSSSTVAGYMAVYFGLVQGPNDDNLDWPFCNKYVRMMIVDQNANPLYAMNSYRGFVTSQSSGGDLWNKPTSSNAAGYWGYSTFMKISDIENTYNYMKNDAVMFSVLIEDMNYYNGDVCSGSFTRSLEEPVPVESRSLNSELDWIDDHGKDDCDEKGHSDGKDDCGHHEHNHGGGEGHGNGHGHGHGNQDTKSTTVPEVKTTEKNVEGPHYNDHDDDGKDDHDEEHDDHDDDNKEHHEDDYDGMMAVGTAIGIAVGTGLFVFLVMCAVLLCVMRSYKRSALKLSTNIILQTSKDSPPPYAEEKVTIEPLAMPKV